uniref:Uncharacterized protein n=1 Tax=Glossina morsitans morsitans TaxID=37546 RepID=A0A1B0FA61_GLOMM
MVNLSVTQPSLRLRSFVRRQSGRQAGKLCTCNIFLICILFFLVCLLHTYIHTYMQSNPATINIHS